tara:strand:- start:143 stop:1777 length:1635 start_codon:yes stop_codon:yes gene_type:complete
MANGPRTIYSRKQRLAPGQYETPLADFLDRLPELYNRYQQNKLALERQQLAEKRYQDSIARQNRLDAENQQRYVAEQKRLDDKVKRDELNRLRSIGRSFINSGDTEQAIKIFEKTGDMDFVSGLRSKAEKEAGREDEFVDIRSMAGRSDTNPFEYRDRLKAFRERYDIRPGDNSSLDSQLFQIESKNNAEIKYRNRGSVPPQEWEVRFGPSGRMDYNNLKNAEKNLEDLAEEKASPSSAITSGMGGATLEERIEVERKTIEDILNQPKYKLETEAEYRARKESEKQVGSILQKANLARTQGLSFPNIGYGETTFDIAMPTENNLADFNNDISKKLDKVLSDPNTPTNEAGSSEEDYPVATEAVPGLSTEEKRELGMPMLNLPTVEAGQDSPQAPTKSDTTLNLGKEISANVKKPKGRYGSVEGALVETYKKMKNIKKLEDKSRYDLEGIGGDQSYRNALKQADKLRKQLKKDILSIYDPNTQRFRYPGYAEMFSPVGDKVMSFGRQKQLDTRNVAGGILGRQKIPVKDIMPFIEELFPPQIASR